MHEKIKACRIFDERIRIEKALVPYKVQAILSAPQRQKLSSYPRGYRVIIGATIEKPDGTKYRYKSDDASIIKIAQLYSRQDLVVYQNHLG